MKTNDQWQIEPLSAHSIPYQLAVVLAFNFVLCLVCLIAAWLTCQFFYLDAQKYDRYFAVFYLFVLFVTYSMLKKRKSRKRQIDC